MALPPFFAGAVNATEPEPLPGVTAPIVGAPGTVAGMKLFDAADAGLGPMALAAVTVQL